MAENDIKITTPAPAESLFTAVKGMQLISFQMKMLQPLTIKMLQVKRTFQGSNNAGVAPKI